MGNLTNYSIVITGEFQKGFDQTEVQQAFADLFKISFDKAAAFVNNKRVLKKDIDYKTAQSYKQQLEKIGLVVVLKEQLAVAEASTKMALEPTEEEILAAKEAGEIERTCPKCQLKQIQSEQCEGCGVYFHKLKETSVEYPDEAYQPSKEVYPTNQEQVSQEENSNDEQTEEEVVVHEASSFSSKAFIAAAIVAFLGALLWSFIAVQFDYELGVIAWLIGGAVGFSAAAFSSHGKTAGTICGVLTLLAILGGKYIGMEHFKSELLGAFSANIEEVNEGMRAVYQQQKIAAKAFADLPSDEESLRQFIVEYQYGEDYTVADLTTEDVDFFTEETQPVLEAFSSNPPDYEQWLENDVYGGINDISSVDLVKEAFSFTDVIFLFLGIGTAFRLGSAEEF